MFARKSDVRNGGRAHILMCGALLLAALISFMPVSMTLASAIPSGCSEVESSVTSNTDEGYFVREVKRSCHISPEVIRHSMCERRELKFLLRGVSESERSGDC